jgi:hypothetical protein
MSATYIFLGPSLPLADAKQILADAEYLPPVSMGDVYRLMARKPSTIAIVDGLFEQTPAVWHKEILFALAGGVRVVGASSMGALRAAELAAFGMEGVGEVFEAFRSGALEDDDEVAVAHAPAADGYRPLSDAMVSIRAGLREAQRAGVISAETHDRLVAEAKQLYYPDRSWARLLGSGGELAALRDFVKRTRPDVKRADAIRLLEQLRDQTGAGHPASFDFEPSWVWEQLVLHEAPADSADDDDDAVALTALRRHVRLHPSRSRDVLATALLIYLAEEQAARRNVAASDSEAVDALLRELGDQVNRKLPQALAYLHRLGPTLAEVRRKQAILRSLGLRAPSLIDAGLTLDELVTWYQRRFGPLTGSPEEHAAAAGFRSTEELVSEMILEYLLDRHP